MGRSLEEMLHFCFMASHWRLLRARGDGHHRALHGSIEHGRWEIARKWSSSVGGVWRERIAPIRQNCFYQGDMTERDLLRRVKDQALIDKDCSNKIVLWRLSNACLEVGQVKTPMIELFLLWKGPSILVFDGFPRLQIKVPHTPQLGRFPWYPPWGMDDLVWGIATKLSIFPLCCHFHQFPPIPIHSPLDDCGTWILLPKRPSDWCFGLTPCSHHPQGTWRTSAAMPLIQKSWELSPPGDYWSRWNWFTSLWSRTPDDLPLFFNLHEVGWFLDRCEDVKMTRWWSQVLLKTPLWKYVDMWALDDESTWSEPKNGKPQKANA